MRKGGGTATVKSLCSHAMQGEIRGDAKQRGSLREPGGRVTKKIGRMKLQSAGECIKLSSGAKVFRMRSVRGYKNDGSKQIGVSYNVKEENREA